MKIDSSTFIYKDQNYKILFYKGDIDIALKNSLSNTNISIDSEWIGLEMEKGNCRIIVLYFNNTLALIFVEDNMAPVNFISLLEDKSVKKILHSARNDFYVFHTEWKDHFKTKRYVNVECTKYLSLTASNFNNTSSLANILSRELGVNINKTWLSNNYLNLDPKDRKPVFEYDNVKNDSGLIQYLLEDVVYLEQLYLKLKEKTNISQLSHYKSSMDIAQSCIEIVSENKNYRFIRHLFHDNEIISE